MKNYEKSKKSYAKIMPAKVTNENLKQSSKLLMGTSIPLDRDRNNMIYNLTQNNVSKTKINNDKNA